MRRTDARVRLEYQSAVRSFLGFFARVVPKRKMFSPTSTSCTTTGSAKKRILRGHGDQPAILDASPSIFEKKPLGAGSWTSFFYMVFFSNSRSAEIPGAKGAT